jgi:hypothetical protein
MAGGGGHFRGGGLQAAAISAAVADVLANTSVRPAAEPARGLAAAASVRLAGIGLASANRVRASVREISTGGRNSSAVGIPACSLSAAQAGFGVMIHAGGIRRGGRIIAAITDVRDNGRRQRWVGLTGGRRHATPMQS